MAEKWTKGPWELRNNFRVIGERNDQRSRFIANCCNELDECREEDKANARLIAQSPALYAFAEWAIRQFQGDSGAGHGHWEQFEEYRNGLAALAKARGEKPSPASVAGE